MWPHRRFITKLGKAFSDNVELSRNRLKVPGTRELRGWGARITGLYVILIILFFLLGVRLFHLTVIKGEENRELSENNRIRTAVIHAPRGIFFDRRGTPLAKNTTAFRVTGLCDQNSPCRTRFMTLDELTQSGISLKSVFLEKDFLREYIFPYETAHVLGYLGEISGEEISNPYYNYQGYLVGDRLGRAGLEAEFEKKLRGVDGKELIEVDAAHNKIRTLGKVDPIPGANLTLSLDIDLQKAAYQALGENPGAVVVTRPKTGEILALVSTPGFDTNLFNKGITVDKYKDLVNSVDKPLVNRAVTEVFPPGSTFKIIPAVAGLESGIIKPDTLIEDTGKVQVGTFSFSNWYFTQYGKTEGQVNMLRAIARSNDIYFYKLGEMVGVEKIAQWGHTFGIGAKTGIELPVEAEGIMPDVDWKEKVRHDQWYLGDTYHLSIGQGDLAVTPLQVNLWAQIIASGGIKCQPTLLKQTGSQTPSKCVDLHIKKETIRIITEGMRRACSSGEDVGYQGTGWPLFDFTLMRETLTESGGAGEKQAVPVACKTGTAEFGDPDNKTHAWFTAFAPLPEAPKTIAGAPSILGDPEIAVTVFVEKGGEGSSVAGPIAKKILEAWFKR